MPPYDLIVWDTFLFSKYTNIEQVYGLLMMFDWPILYLSGSTDENIRMVGKWCREGTFVDEVKKVMETTTYDFVDMEFLEKNRAIFEKSTSQFQLPTPNFHVSTLTQPRRQRPRSRCIKTITSTQPATEPLVDVSLPATQESAQPPADRAGTVRKPRIKRDLQFLNSNREILDLGPMNLSSVDNAHKETWFMQAKACIKLLLPGTKARISMYRRENSKIHTLLSAWLSGAFCQNQTGC